MSRNPDTSRKRTAKIIAVLITLLFHGGLVILFLFSYLRWPPEDVDPRDLEPTKEILFGGEFVRLGNVSSLTDNTAMVSDEPMPAEVNQAETANEAIDMENAGEVGEPAPLATSNLPSPMEAKEQPQPQKTGPTKEEIEAAEKAKREKEAAERIRKQMNFGSQGNTQASSGQPDGGNKGDNAAGIAGHNLVGRTIASWGANSSTKSGEIRIEVKVNARGEVISATYVGGNGPVSADAAMRRKCIEASKASRFSIREGSDADQTGIITWRFR